MPRPGLPIAPLALIAAIAGAGAVAFGYTAGFLSPHRLTPAKMVNAFAPPGGPSLGHRRNHAKGICFTGEFDASGAATPLSTAAVLAPGSYPVIGRFNVATTNAEAQDATVRVRGIGVQIAAPDGALWRSAMIDAPVFPAATPQAFYELLRAQASKDPGAMKSYVATHSAILGFLAWATKTPPMSSYAEERFNSLNSFTFTNAAGARRIVRWSLLPQARPIPLNLQAPATRDPDFLEADITARVARQPQRWTLLITVANPGDSTADPTQPWPAIRRTVAAGTLVVRQIEPEANGPCRDINYDPTVLPPGISLSDDPFPAARSAAYAVSYNRRTAESADYPRTGAAP